MLRASLRHAALLVTAALTACATPAPSFDADALLAELRRRPNVLLGEVHDNRAQHAVRAEALRRLLEGGARPALAFEQFDREQQAVLDEARRAALPPGVERVDHIVQQAGRGGWNWTLYRPYLELALRFDLPIVAANLSRSDANRAAREGHGAVFDAAARGRLRLDAVPLTVVSAQVQAVEAGHCNTLSPAAAARLAQAQIARDAALAEAIRPHLQRGVILFTGNGHARSDIGVPIFLSPDERARTWTVGLVESESATTAQPGHFDARFITPTQARPDPCAALRSPK